jgi:hypothetical protein
MTLFFNPVLIIRGQYYPAGAKIMASKIGTVIAIDIKSAFQIFLYS